MSIQGVAADRAYGAVYLGSADFPSPRHFHSQLEFVFVLRGRLRVEVGRSTHLVHAGQLIWHLPGIAHAMSAMTVDHDFRVVYIQPDVAARIAGDDSGRPSAFSGWVQALAPLIAGRPVVDVAQRDLDRLMELTEVRHREVATTNLQQAECLLRIALSATQKDHNDRLPNSLPELASCLLLHDPLLTRAQVCSLLDVSDGYLSRCFQHELASSFRDLRSQLRVVRFVAHACRDSRNMLGAALDSGFGSYSQAHRIFSRIVGMSPRQYFKAGGREQLSVQQGSPFQVL